MRVKKMNKKNKKTTGEKRVPKGEKPLLTAFRLQSKVYFLTYKGISDFSGEKITKNQLAKYLVEQNPNDRKVKPEKYLICQQTYQDGTPHFHAILIYPKRKQVINQRFYDYLGIHPNIQTMRNMKAALEYVCKEDTTPLTNMDLDQQKRVARAKNTISLYQLLENQMKKDPFNFNVYDFCNNHNLFKQVCKANYPKAINLLYKSQESECRAVLRKRPGIRYITRKLIESSLNSSELLEYDSWDGYSTIIDHINQIVESPNKSLSSRLPNKTKHLLLVGPSDIGKSALLDHVPSSFYPYPGLDSYFSTYYLNVAQRYFPPYTTYMSSLVTWQQFTIDSTLFPKKRYNQLLVYLDGSPTQLPIKGKLPVRRMDNPKHILTSNRSLQQQILKTFKSEQSRSLARMNLKSRLDQVVVPPEKSLHFLRKLFHHR